MNKHDRRRFLKVLGAGAAQTGDAEDARPECSPGDRTRPRGGTGRAAHQDARGPRPTPRHGGRRQASRPSAQRHTRQRFHSARGPRRGQHSPARGGGLPGPPPGACGRGVAGRGVGARRGRVPPGHRPGGLASPRSAPWAAQGVHILARPWPHVGPLCTKAAFPLDCASMRGPWPQRQTGPMVPGRAAQCPAAACAACPGRARCPTATLGHGRRLSLREDEPFQQKLRATIKPTRGRASLRHRTALEHARSHPWAHQGRRARSKGLRKPPFDGRRHAAVRTLQVAARSAEERQLVS
jgi:hypothetical protein